MTIEQQDTPNGDATGQNSGAQPEKTFTQSELENIVRERLEREKRKAEQATQRAQEEARTKALAEQGEFKTLAEQREARIRELEPKAEQAERYSQVLDRLLEQERKGVPSHIITLLDKLDPVDQLDYIAQNREQFRTQEQSTQSQDVAWVRQETRAPRPKTKDDIAADSIEMLQRSGRYSGI